MATDIKINLHKMGSLIFDIKFLLHDIYKCLKKFAKKFCLIYLNSFPNKPLLLRVCSRSILKTLWEKEKLLVTSNFSFSHSVFYLLEELSAISIKFEIVACKLIHFGRVYNSSFAKEYVAL